MRTVKTSAWIAGFLALYGGHALCRLALAERIPAFASAEALRVGAVATLAGLVLLVAAHVATRDEVLRRLALYAAAASAAATGVLSYGLSALGIAAPLIAGNIWAAGLFVFLCVYGVLSWRSGS